MTVHLWSQTAASNSSADGSINWAEGQSPGTVNNSARAMMAAVAKWRDDISGKLLTGGSSTAYTLTTNQAPASLIDGFHITFRCHATSGANPTLAINGLAAKALRTITTGAMEAGVLIAGTPYGATYVSATDEFLLEGHFDSQWGVPIGAMLPYAGTATPFTNYAFCYGQAVSRTTYATLFARLGTEYGSGDGSTTFNLPDLRGRAPFGRDDMGGSAASRITSAVSGVDGADLGAAGGAQSVTLDATMIPSHTHTGTTDSDGAHTHDLEIGSTSALQVGGATQGYQSGTGTTLTTASGGAHTHAFTTAATGGGLAHNNLPPALIVNYILRVI